MILKLANYFRLIFIFLTSFVFIECKTTEKKSEDYLCAHKWQWTNGIMTAVNEEMNMRGKRNEY